MKISSIQTNFNKLQPLGKIHIPESNLSESIDVKNEQTNVVKVITQLTVSPKERLEHVISPEEIKDLLALIMGAESNIHKVDIDL